MKLNIFKSDKIEALSEGTVEERFGHLKGEISEKLDKYGSNLILKEYIGPGPLSLEKFMKEKKEQYSSDEIIDFLANEEKRFLTSPAYMQFFKSVKFRLDEKSRAYHPKIMPTSIKKLFEDKNDADVVYEVFYLGCLKPIDDAIAGLEGKNITFDNTGAYTECEKPYIKMLNNDIFRVGLKAIGYRLGHS